MVDFSKCTVLVVDDSEPNIDILVDALGNDYEVSVAKDGESALRIIEFESPDLILLDIMMPNMDGYEVCRRLKNNSKTLDIPIIFLTAMDQLQNKTRGFELGAIDYITKPFEILEVKERVKTHLALMLAKKELSNQNIILEEKVRERTRELTLTQSATIISLATLAEFRDPETGGHIKRTQNYVKALAQHLKNHDKFKSFLDDSAIDLLYRSAPLHDIGKVGVPDHILLKPGKLTDKEFEEMKKHTIYGRDAILAAEKTIGSSSTFLRYAKEIAYGHQEKWDGSGYTQGAKGEEIPVSARLMAVADVYDALISKRVYKPPFPHSKAVEIIKEGRGNHFDPDMVDAFTELEDDFREIALEFSDSQEERKNLARS